MLAGICPRVCGHQWGYDTACERERTSHGFLLAASLCCRFGRFVGLTLVTCNAASTTNLESDGVSSLPVWNCGPLCFEFRSHSQQPYSTDGMAARVSNRTNEPRACACNWCCVWVEFGPYRLVLVARAAHQSAKGSGKSDSCSSPPSSSFHFPLKFTYGVCYVVCDILDSSSWLRSIEQFRILNICFVLFLFFSFFFFACLMTAIGRRSVSLLCVCERCDRRAGEFCVMFVPVRRDGSFDRIESSCQRKLKRRVWRY